MTDKNDKTRISTSKEAVLSAKRLVIKVGSALLMQGREGDLNRDWMSTLGADIAAARQRGQEVVLVSSGAIALGRGSLGLTGAHLTLEQNQAAAAAGQIALAHAWQEILGPRELKVAQILLTLDDTEQRRRYLNARSTLSTLLQLGAIPVINENDTVATQEIRYGDNDRLAARVASMISADCLVLFSDIDGLYNDPERLGDPQAHIAEVDELNEDIFAMAGEAGSHFSSGGMKTKLQAARIATEAGASMVLTSGKADHPLQSMIEDRQRSTLFRSKANPRAARKNWIAASLQTGGKIFIDAGAGKALEQGRSLLPIGISSIEGQFERGDCVAVYGPDGVEIARGLVEHAADTAEQIIGKQTAEIAAFLSYNGRVEMIHRDNLVMTQKSGT